MTDVQFRFPNLFFIFTNMPQEFHIVRCYKCEMFQVDQVKKSIKWICKVCHEKQSIRKVYGRGSGSDCRKYVQKLNLEQGSSHEKDCIEQPEDEETVAENNDIYSSHTTTKPDSGPTRNVDWSKYLEPDPEIVQSKQLQLSNIDQSLQSVLCTTDRNDFRQYNQIKKRRNDNWADSSQVAKRCLKGRLESTISTKATEENFPVEESVKITPQSHPHHKEDKALKVNNDVLSSSKWFKYT